MAAMAERSDESVPEASLSRPRNARPSAVDFFDSDMDDKLTPEVEPSSSTLPSSPQPPPPPLPPPPLSSSPPPGPSPVPSPLPPQRTVEKVQFRIPTQPKKEQYHVPPRPPIAPPRKQDGDYYRSEASAPPPRESYRSPAHPSAAPSRSLSCHDGHPDDWRLRGRGLPEPYSPEWGGERAPRRLEPEQAKWASPPRQSSRYEYRSQTGRAGASPSRVNRFYEPASGGRASSRGRASPRGRNASRGFTLTRPAAPLPGLSAADRSAPPPNLSPEPPRPTIDPSTSDVLQGLFSSLAVNVAMNTLLVARRDAAAEAHTHAEQMLKETAIVRERTPNKAMGAMYARREAEATVAQQAASEAAARLAEHETACAGAAKARLAELEEEQRQRKERKPPRTAAEVEAQLDDMWHEARQESMAASMRAPAADKRLGKTQGDVQVSQYQLRELEDELETVALLADRVGALEIQVDGLPSSVSEARAELHGARVAVAETASAIKALEHCVRGGLDDETAAGLLSAKGCKPTMLGHNFLQASENGNALSKYSENIENQRKNVQALLDRITALEVGHAAAMAARAERQAALEDERAARATAEAMAVSGKLGSISTELETIQAQHRARDHARAASIERTLDIAKRAETDIDGDHAVLEQRLSHLEQRLHQCEAEAAVEAAEEVPVKEEDDGHVDHPETRAECDMMLQKTMRWIDMQQAYDEGEDTEEGASVASNRPASDNDPSLSATADDIESSHGLNAYIKQSSEGLERLEDELTRLKDYVTQATKITSRVEGGITSLESLKPEVPDDKQPADIEPAPDDEDLFDKAVGVRRMIAELNALLDEHDATRQRLSAHHAKLERESLPKAAESLTTLKRLIARRESRAATAECLLGRRAADAAALDARATQLGAALALPQQRQALAARAAELRRLEDEVGAVVDRALALIEGDARGVRELADGMRRVARHLGLDLAAAAAVRARMKEPVAAGALRRSSAQRKSRGADARGGGGASKADSSAASAGASRHRGGRDEAAGAGDDDDADGASDDGAASVSSCDIPLGASRRTKRKRGRKDVVVGGGGGKKARGAAQAAVPPTSQDLPTSTSSATTARLRPRKAGSGRGAGAATAAAKASKGRGRGSGK